MPPEAPALSARLTGEKPRIIGTTETPEPILSSAGLLAVYLLHRPDGGDHYWGHLLGINIETEMRRHAFGHLQKLSFRFYANARPGTSLHG